MKRPVWCPHLDCNFKTHSQNLMCVGYLPKPERHDDSLNDYRLCIDTRETGHDIFDLQINKGDVWNLIRILKTIT
ncbi:MAG: hypothetical protein UR43_C0019G0015 [candidate division TM6 bacterium GW2011_GWF2_33_332]|nr:MAG: hypothetical protein UR43_C0019G0015 [candidate division TM6 bacterium GW2011_GWF2_33_332]